MINLENLKKVLLIFSEDSGLDNEQVFYFFEKGLANGFINENKLKEELDKIIPSKYFDWIGLVEETNLLINPKPYSSIELINYIKSWLWDYLYPERALSIEGIKTLSEKVMAILQNYHSNDGWMFSYDLYNELKKDKKYENLEYYNLWKIDFINYNIEIKGIENKDREIGYLRFRQ